MRTDGRMILFMIYPLCKVSSLIIDKILPAKKISRKTFYIQLSSVVLTNNSTRYDKMKIHIFKNLLCNIWISCSSSIGLSRHSSWVLIRATTTTNVYEICFFKCVLYVYGCYYFSCVFLRVNIQL